jgi:hypothetical protein
LLSDHQGHARLDEWLIFSAETRRALQLSANASIRLSAKTHDWLILGQPAQVRLMLGS